LNSRLALASLLVAFGAALLLAFSDPALLLLVAELLSAGVAVWGAYQIAGVCGLVGALSLLFVTISPWDPYLLAFGALSLLGALGAARLLVRRLPVTALRTGLLMFAVFDIIFIVSGVGQQVTELLPALFDSPSFFRGPPLLNRIWLGGQVLGAGDILFAALLATVVIRMRARRSEIVLATGCYAVLALALFATAQHEQIAVPATLPGAVALLVFLGRRKLRDGNIDVVTPGRSHELRHAGQERRL
jgi:hypothetical protein